MRAETFQSEEYQIHSRGHTAQHRKLQSSTTGTTAQTIEWHSIKQKAKQDNKTSNRSGIVYAVDKWWHTNTPLASTLISQINTQIQRDLCTL